MIACEVEGGRRKEVIACEVDHGVGNEQLFEVLEAVFSLVFLLELFVRLRWGVRLFFKDAANWLDFLLVLLSLLDLGFKVAGGEVGLRRSQILRLFRLLRLGRMLRAMRLFRELTLILSGMANAVRTLLWMMLLLGLLLFAAAIFCTEVFGKDETGKYDFLVPGTSETVAEFFRSIPMSMYTLFYCLGEGCSEKIVIPVLREAPEMCLFWVSFICLTTYCFLNLVVGVFVENTLSIAQADAQKIVQSKEREQRMIRENLRKAFDCIDANRSGRLEKEEFQHAINHNREVQDAMFVLGLADISDLFDRIDTDRDGAMSVEEFIEGVFLLQKGEQPAKSADVVAIYRHTCKLQDEVSALRKDLKQLLQLLPLEPSQGSSCAATWAGRRLSLGAVGPSSCGSLVGSARTEPGAEAEPAPGLLGAMAAAAAACAVAEVAAGPAGAAEDARQEEKLFSGAAPLGPILPGSEFLPMANRPRRGEPLAAAGSTMNDECCATESSALFLAPPPGRSKAGSCPENSPACRDLPTEPTSPPASVSPSLQTQLAAQQAALLVQQRMLSQVLELLTPHESQLRKEDEEQGLLRGGGRKTAHPGDGGGPPSRPSPTPLRSQRVPTPLRSLAVLLLAVSSDDMMCCCGLCGSVIGRPVSAAGWGHNLRG